MPSPSYVTLVTSMHIGAPARPVVKVGEKVNVGTLVAEGVGAVSSPIYSSVSGTVKKIEDVTVASGQKVPAIIIESDGAMTPDVYISPFEINSKDELIEAIRNSGVVGLGGAGFPTHVKFNVPDGTVIDELIINCAECEPYITSDTRTMLDKSEDMAFGIEQIMKHLDIKKVIIAIEDNKKSAIESMRRMANSIEGATISVIKSRYPQGAEKVLIYHTTGKVVPAGKLPLHVGTLVCNCTTVAAIGSFIKTGMPLVNKCVTVDGGAVREPKNVIVPIGTSIKDVIEFCGGFSAAPGKIIYGGPMMGISVPDVESPIMKNTNAILVFDEKEGIQKEQTQCIRCGACASHCPYNLTPFAFAKAYRNSDVEALRSLRVDICMECGCCAFVCPANIPLVQMHKLSKDMLRAADKKEKEGTK